MEDLLKQGCIDIWIDEVVPCLRDTETGDLKETVAFKIESRSYLKNFKKKWSKFVLENGYMPIMPQTGHRGYWHDWEHWKEVQASYTSEFWDNYRAFHKGTGDDVCKQVKQHFQAKSKWCDRMSLNLPTQGEYCCPV